MKKTISLLLALLLAFGMALPIFAVETEGEGEAITYPALTESNYNELYVADGLVMGADFFRMNKYWNPEGEGHIDYVVPASPVRKTATVVDGVEYNFSNADVRNANQDACIAAITAWKTEYKDFLNSFTWTSGDMKFSLYQDYSKGTDLITYADRFTPVVDAADGYMQFRNDYHTSGGIVFSACPSAVTAVTNELVLSLDYRKDAAAPNLFYNIRVSAKTTEEDGVRLTAFHSNSALGAQYYINKTVGGVTTEAGAYDAQSLARNAIEELAKAYAAELLAAVVPTDGVTVTYTAAKVSNDEYNVIKSTVKGTATAVTELAANFKIANRQNPAYTLTHNPNINIPLSKPFTFSQSLGLKDGNDEYMIRTEQGTLFSVNAPYDGTATTLNNTNYIGWGATQSHIKMYAYRHYTRVLSNAELVQNHFADLCKWFRLDVSSLYDENGLKASEAEIAFLSAYLVKYTFDDDRAAVVAALTESIDAWNFEGEGDAFEVFAAHVNEGKIDGAGVRALPAEYYESVYTAYKAFVDENAGATNAALQAALDSVVTAILSTDYADYYGKTPVLSADVFFADQTLSEAAKHFFTLAKENDLDMSVLAPIDPVIREHIYASFGDLPCGVFYHTAVLQARLADTAAELVEYYFGDGLVDDALGFLGYQIRLYGEKSFRAVFSVDKAVIDTLEAHGYKVTVGVLQRERTDDAMEVEKTAEGWVAVDTAVKQATVYESGKGYDSKSGEDDRTYCFEKDGTLRYAYEVVSAPTATQFFVGYVAIEREGNEDTVFYLEVATQNFKKGITLRSLADTCKEEYGILSPNIQALTPVKKVILPIIFVGGESLSDFRIVTDEATKDLSDDFVSKFRAATRAVLQTVDAADCQATDKGLIRFVAGDASSIALVDGNIIFTYTGDGEAALTAFAAAIAAPEDGYPTYAYGDEEPWPICLLGTVHSLETAN